MQKEINKYLKRINVEKLKNNHKECIELYNLIGGCYSDIGSHDEAIYYHEQALDLSKTVGDRLRTATTFRFIGEAKAANGQFHEGIDYIEKYLELTQRLKDQVELQRAYTTLGRVHLMQAQELKDQGNHIDVRFRDIAKKAEKRFQTALTLAESVKNQVDASEFAQMKGGLLLNIGLINDLSGHSNEAIVMVTKAIEILKTAKLKEELYRCHVVLTTIYRLKGNLKYAVRHSDEALTLAKSIGRKIHICEAYMEKGFVKLVQRDFRGAKHSFAQAYLEKSPSDDDHAKAIKLTKIAHLIVVYYEKLSKNDSDKEMRLKICDKLGDLFVATCCYNLAVEFYRRALADAKVLRKPKSELARILYSIAETYADDGKYDHALVCYEKEFTYRNGNEVEQCQSLIKIAHMHEYLEKEDSKVSESYEKALDKAGKDPKLMYNVLRDYVAFMQKKSFNIIRCKELENVLDNLKSYPEVVAEIDAECCEEAVDIEDEVANVDDIITDDEGDNEVLMVGRKRTRGPTKFKPNEVGDTPLHEACIKGDIKRVKSLISQGHAVNPRDNAGWIPLHEACNHGHYEIVEYLIENGADVCNRGLKGMSPLHDSATNGHYEIMRLLIKNGANVIALTDTGETVLNCLRDHKKRNYQNMSNQEMGEYKLMESELLNEMDKCGFNLMEANIKNLGTKSNLSNASQALQEVRPKPRINIRSIESENVPQPVKDYRQTMGILKRKRLHEETVESPKKANLPATFHTSSNTSAKTKDWLIDDVSKEKQIIKRRQLTYDILESDSEEEGCGVDEEMEVNEEISASDDIEVIEEPRKDSRPTVIEATPPICENTFDQSNCEFATISSPVSEVWSVNSMNLSNHSKSLNLLAKPLLVQVGDTKLLIPLKDGTSIKMLKDSVVDRYVLVAKARPIISLAPMSDPSCHYFDNDLCQDVIRENVVANIEGWELKPLDETYVENCAKQTIEPLTYIIADLKRIESYGISAVDLSFIRIPRTHVISFAASFCYRDILTADLTGAISLFDTQVNSEAMLDCLGSWKKLTHLTMRCVGLRRQSFDCLCAKLKCSQLKFLDLSYNTTIYKADCSEEFVRNIEKLRQGCPELKRLDMRKNNLLFAPDSIQPQLTKLVIELDVSDQNNFTVY